ncbi:hypothetical protein SUGI_0246470 [Cryptomeria japonica]|nr:hypothetical protein SUGI_0246470 [Cryptomeria japonica]
MRGVNLFADYLEVNNGHDPVYLGTEYNTIVSGIRGASEGTSAAVLLSLIGSAGTLASLHFQFSRVHTIHVDFACRGGALPIGRIDGKRNVEAIHQQDIGVLATLGVLCQWWERLLRLSSSVGHCSHQFDRFLARL